MSLASTPQGDEAGASAAFVSVSVAIVALGALMFYLSVERPSLLPFWAPWDFSWPEYLALALALLWYGRGVARAMPEVRPPLWRHVAFLLGVASLYAVLETRFDYMAQHMFFLNRVQHVVMHHLGPFLIALGWPGEALKRGLPPPLRRLVEHRTVRAFVHALQQPLLAAFLFVGLFYFWLIPPVHFRAMLDARLYAVMNWSMVADGILFWSLVLDPRPKPPARISFGARAALSFAVMFPQILLGATITFSTRDLYPFYDLCGRLYPSIGALADQHIGGIVSWIPPSMMSAVGVVLVLNFLRLDEDTRTETSEEAAAMAALASRWTGL
jgi:putative membrane protein